MVLMRPIMQHETPWFRSMFSGSAMVRVGVGEMPSNMTAWSI